MELVLRGVGGQILHIYFGVHNRLLGWITGRRQCLKNVGADWKKVHARLAKWWSLDFRRGIKQRVPIQRPHKTGARTQGDDRRSPYWLLLLIPYPRLKAQIAVL